MVKVNSEGRLESKEINVLRIYVFSKNKIQWSLEKFLIWEGGSVTVVLLRSREEKPVIFWDE